MRPEAMVSSSSPRSLPFLERTGLDIRVGSAIEGCPRSILQRPSAITYRCRCSSPCTSEQPCFGLGACCLCLQSKRVCRSSKRHNRRRTILKARNAHRSCTVCGGCSSHAALFYSPRNFFEPYGQILLGQVGSICAADGTCGLKPLEAGTAVGVSAKASRSFSRLVLVEYALIAAVLLRRHPDHLFLTA
jgi:hypothetical protein